MRKLDISQLEAVRGEYKPNLKCAIGTGVSVAIGSLAGPWGAIAGGVAGVSIFC